MSQSGRAEPEKHHIAISGAGIAGLTTALALARFGHKVDIFEAAAEWGDIGAGITLSPNAMRGLGFVGVADDVIALGAEPHSQEISHWQTGKVLVTVDREGTAGRYGSAYVYIHRADLHRVLREAAADAGVAMHRDKCAIDARLDAERAELVFADGGVAHADLIIAADGLKSRLRQLFSPVDPYFTGHVAYRALAPATSEIEALIRQPGMHIGPGKMVVRYPLRAGSLLNLVFFARQDGWCEDGWSIPAELSELDEMYADWCPDVQKLLAGIEPGSLFKWAINAHQPLPNGWSLANKLTLVGDAAHAMTPFLGQGAATSIEDGVILARLLTREHSTAEALSRYYASRYERTSFIQQESNDNADRMQGDETELYGIGKIRNEESLGLFSYDCVSEQV